MQDIVGVTDVTIDTTARGFFRSAHQERALTADLTAALKKIKLRLREVAPAKVTTPLEVYEINVKGLG